MRVLIVSPAADNIPFNVPLLVLFLFFSVFLPFHLLLSDILPFYLRQYLVHVVTLYLCVCGGIFLVLLSCCLALIWLYTLLCPVPAGADTVQQYRTSAKKPTCGL